MEGQRKHDPPGSPTPGQPTPVAASSAEGTWQAMGSHRVRIDADVVEWEGIGPVGLVDIRSYQGIRDQVLGRFGYCLALVNAKQSAGISADARRYLVEQSRTHAERRIATAVYGVSGAAYAMAALVIRAMELLGRRKNKIMICADEAAARAWLDDQRLQYQSGPA